MKQEKIRVLHLIDGLGLGGAQAYLLELCRANPYPDLHLEVASLHGAGPFAPRLCASGIAHHALAGAKWNPLFIPRLRALLRAGNYDLVHAHLVVSGFICEALHGWLGRPRLIEHLHSPVQTHTGSEYQRLLERLMFRRATRYIACSGVVAESVRRFRPQVMKRVVTLRNGVDVEGLERGLIGRAEARRQLGLSENDFVIGSAGRLSPLKNFPLLLRAAARLLPSIPALKVVIFGAGGEEASLRRLVGELGLQDAALLPGYDPQASAKLGLFDIFVLPSDYEGLPMVLIEALAAAIPCVTTDFASAAEVIAPEADGLIVPRGDAEALVAALERLWRDPALRQRLGGQGRQKARDRFSLARHWQGLRALYEDALRD